jgi:class 3 adenylate cyclase
MSNVNDIKKAEGVDLLVSFFDLTQFARCVRNRSAQETFELLYDYYEFAGELIEGAGGRVVKFIGDAGLVAFPEEAVSQGVLALRNLKETGDAWMADHETPCRHRIKAHFGHVHCGMIGTRSEKRFDLFGETVNTAAVVRSNGLAITPQVFRKLGPDVRKLFKKHTPPITYIPVEESHQDP